MFYLKQFMLAVVLRLLSLFQVLGPMYKKRCIPNFYLQQR